MIAKRCRGRSAQSLHDHDEPPRRAGSVYVRSVLVERDLIRFIRAACADQLPIAVDLLATRPELVIERLERHEEVFLAEGQVQLYAGDTALHAAAFCYQVELARQLVDLGADVRARNRRGAEPLHAAVIGNPGSDSWDPPRQCDVIAFLIGAGADPNAAAAGGVTPLHRAVRNRCSEAVRVLLAAGADPTWPTGTAPPRSPWPAGRPAGAAPAARRPRPSRTRSCGSSPPARTRPDRRVIGALSGNPRDIATVVVDHRGMTIANGQVHLREITADNQAAVEALSVTAEQDDYVGSVTDSLQEAAETPDARPWYRALYAGDTPVGFVMISDGITVQNPEFLGPYFLWRLLIDQRHQGKGYGGAAIGLVLEQLRSTRPDAQVLITSAIPGPHSPLGFYLRQGFRETGVVHQGEVVLDIPIPRSPSTQ
jgi:GNAT superfamily N-acetyltransferase